MLTDTACRIAKGAEKPYMLADANGLYLYVTSNGYKSWRLKYRFAGKAKRLSFGPYLDVTLVEARDLRGAVRRQLRAGVDPALDKRQRSAAESASVGATFETISEEWLASIEPTWAPRYASIVRRSMKKDVCPKLGKLPIDAIATPMVTC